MINTGILAYSRERASSSPIIPCGRIWPCGDFGLGYRKKMEGALKTTIPVYVHPSGINLGRIFGLYEIMRGGAVALGLSVLPNSHKLKTPRPETYGRKGITGYGRKMVKSAAALLQAQVGRENLAFLTLTVPEAVDTALVAIAQSWGRTVNRLMQFLVRRLKAAGLQAVVVAVTETQPKRLGDGSLGCLHLHLVFQSRKSRYSPYLLSPQEIREWWLSALVRVAGCPIVSDSCEKLHGVRKDAGAYLAKYMSKGSGGAEELAAIAGWECVPRQWWNMSKGARSLVKKNTLTSEFALGLLSVIIDAEKNLEKPRGFKYLGQVTIAIEIGRDERRGVGWFGTLESGLLKELHALTTEATIAFNAI